MLREIRNGTPWRANSNGHPLPVLPEMTYLEGEYLAQLARSNPLLLQEATRLIRYIKEDMEGKENSEGRRKGAER